LQTIGICVGSIVLTVIAFFIFTLWITFFPSQSWDEESESSREEEEEDLVPLVKRKRRQHKR
jgi:phosphotransferase system  glucose/maltose/N-acetylglucosamine-specific IIC component